MATWFQVTEVAEVSSGAIWHKSTNVTTKGRYSMSKRPRQVSRKSLSKRPRHNGRKSVGPSVVGGSLPIVLAALVVFVMSSLLLWHFSTSATGAATGSGAVDSSTPSLDKGPANYTKPHASCGLTGLPNCPTPDPGWISVTDASPTSAAAAIGQSSIFAGINAAHQGNALDLPVMVYPLSANTGSDYYNDEHWVVSVRDDSGVEVGIYDFVFDASSLRIRFASYAILARTDTRYGHSYPNIAASIAVADLSRVRGVNARVGVQPELVFFQLPDSWQGPLATHHWTAGGQSPIDPLWHIVGADGVDYFVGEDHNVYTRTQLPIG